MMVDIAIVVIFIQGIYGMGTIIHRYFLSKLSASDEQAETLALQYMRINLLTYITLIETGDNLREHHYLDLDNMYKEYIALGGNGEIEVRYNKIQKKRDH